MEVDAIFTETKRAINDGRFHDARLLYTILINGHKRTPRALVGRAATTLFGGFRLAELVPVYQPSGYVRPFSAP